MNQRRISKKDIAVGDFIFIAKPIVLIPHDYDTSDRLEIGNICTIEAIDRTMVHRNRFMISLKRAEGDVVKIVWNRLRDNIITKNRT